MQNLQILIIVVAVLTLSIILRFFPSKIVKNSTSSSWSGDGKAMRRAYFLSNLTRIPFEFIFLYIVIRVSYGVFTIPGRIISLIIILGIIWELVFLFLIKIRLNFVDELEIGESHIKLSIKNHLVELPIKDTKIYQLFGIGRGGSYLKCEGKWYFVPVTPGLYLLGTALTKLPGHRDYHIWIPTILFIVAMIIFLIYLKTLQF